MLTIKWDIFQQYLKHCGVNKTRIACLVICELDLNLNKLSSQRGYYFSMNHRDSKFNFQLTVIFI
jgi:hypothetical protein